MCTKSEEQKAFFSNGSQGDDIKASKMCIYNEILEFIKDVSSINTGACIGSKLNLQFLLEINKKRDILTNFSLDLRFCYEHRSGQ